MTDNTLPRELRVETVLDERTGEQVLASELERRNAVRGATDGARRVNGKLVRVLPGLPQLDHGETISEAELLERNAAREILRKRQAVAEAKSRASVNLLGHLQLRDTMEARIAQLEARLATLEAAAAAAPQESQPSKRSFLSWTA